MKLFRNWANWLKQKRGSYLANRTERREKERRLSAEIDSKFTDSDLKNRIGKAIIDYAGAYNPEDLIGTVTPERVDGMINSIEGYGNRVCQDGYAVLVGDKDECRHKEKLRHLTGSMGYLTANYVESLRKLEDNYLFWYSRYGDRKRDVTFYKWTTMFFFSVVFTLMLSRSFGWF